MDFAEYQKLAKTTAMYPNEYKIFYPAMGLAGEAGEIANKIKKKMRGDGEINLADLEKELGDVLWYVSMVSTDTGLDLATIAEKNVAKLKSRMERGVIKGDGDNR